jgi:hypothetical protein
MNLRDKNILIGCKLVFGLISFSALVTEIATLSARGKFDPLHFFSLFTYQVNLIAIIAFFLSAVATAGDRQGFKINMLRGATVVYMLVVSVGFIVLLSDFMTLEFSAVPWDNLVIHYIMPLALLFDWFLDPPKVRIGFKQALLWFVYPLAYMAYVFTQGSISGAYTYDFIDPNKNSLVSVARTTGTLLVTTLFFIWSLSHVSRTTNEGKKKPKR